jgi:hypothetical protein
LDEPDSGALPAKNLQESELSENLVDGSANESCMNSSRSSIEQVETFKQNPQILGHPVISAIGSIQGTSDHISAKRRHHTERTLACNVR